MEDPPPLKAEAGDISRTFERLENAINKGFESLRLPELDTQTAFWTKYKKEADDNDAEFLEKYNKDLDNSLQTDSSLGQAGLFSAVSSAFIIQIQPGLQPDPNDTTQALLRILIHSVNSTLFSPDELLLPVWSAPQAIVDVQSILYASLSGTLLVAFLAVLGKQWLTYYTRVGTRGTMAERCGLRQQKFDGLRRWGFNIIMEALPVLLQLALVLFASAITRYLWTIHSTVAGVVLAFTSFGVVFYLFIVISATLSPTCPFQTPMSIILPQVIQWLKDTPAHISWLNDRWRETRKGISNSLHFRTDLAEDPALIESGNRNISKPRLRDEPFLPLESLQSGNHITAISITWMLETSTDPEVVAAAAAMVPEIQWPLGIDVSHSLVKLRDTFAHSYEFSPQRIPTLRVSAERSAYTCGKAFYQLFMEQQPTNPSQYLHEIFEDCMSSPVQSLRDVMSTNALLQSLMPPYSAEPQLFGPRISPEHLFWVMHVMPAYFFNSPLPHSHDDPAPYTILHRLAEALDRVPVITHKAFCDYLLSVAICFGAPANRKDLAVLDKSRFASLIFSQVSQQFIAALDDRQLSISFFSNVRTALRDAIQLAIHDEIKHNLYIGWGRHWYHSFCVKLESHPVDPSLRHDIQGLVMRLGFQLSDLSIHNLLPANKLVGSQFEDGEWIIDYLRHYSDISEWGEDHYEAVSDGLMALAHVNGCGRYVCNHEVVQMITYSMWDDKPYELRKSAFYLVWCSSTELLTTESIQSLLAELEFSKHLCVAVMDILLQSCLHGLTTPLLLDCYTTIVEILCRNPIWRPTVQKDLLHWLGLFGKEPDQILHRLYFLSTGRWGSMTPIVPESRRNHYEARRELTRQAVCDAWCFLDSLDVNVVLEPVAEYTRNLLKDGELVATRLQGPISEAAKAMTSCLGGSCAHGTVHAEEEVLRFKKAIAVLDDLEGLIEARVNGGQTKEG